MLEKLRAKGFDVESYNHAEAILSVDFPGILDRIESILNELVIPIEEIIGSGGGEAEGTQRMRHSFDELGWKKHNFKILKIVDGEERTSTSHEIDHLIVVKDDNKVYKIALEIEWNNKDPFFDRDLENFKRLYSEGVISIGILITRGASLQNAFRDLVYDFAVERNVQNFEDLVEYGISPTERQREGVLERVTRDKNPMTFQESWSKWFVADKYGQATTHWEKLQDRVRRGVGNPCPLLLIGMPLSVVKP